jgi:hypothetical protein
MKQRKASSRTLKLVLTRTPTAGELLKARNERVKAGVGFGMDRLHTRGVVEMGLSEAQKVRGTPVVFRGAEPLLFRFMDATRGNSLL